MRKLALLILAASASCLPAGALEVTVSWSPPTVYAYPPPADLTYEGSVTATFHGDEPMTPVDASWLVRIDSSTWRGTWLWDDVRPRDATFVPDGGGDPVAVTAVRQPAYPLDLGAHDGLVVTIATEPAHLWSPETGIYVWGLYENCLQSGSDWERPGAVSAYAPGGAPLWNEPVGLRINGQSTRYHTRKGLRSYFDDYGPVDWLETDLYGDGPERFGRLVYKSTLSPGHLLSSSLFEPLHQDLGHLGSRHRLAGLYLGGEYWGAYSVRERLDDHWVEVTHELADDGDYTLIKDDEAVEGDVQEWYDFLAAYAVPPQAYGSHAWFVAVSAALDLGSYMDWMYLNILGASADNGWVNNIALLRLPGSGWRYIMWDEEGLMAQANLQSNHFRFYAAATFAEYEQFRPPVWSMGDWWAPHQPWRDLFRGLMQNSEFKARFSARIDELTAGPLAVPVLQARIDSLQNLHSQEMARHGVRWGQPSGAYGTEVQRARNWLAARAPIVADQKTAFFAYFAVPVELSEFTVAAGAGGAALAWRTERERDNRGFQVWRSLAGPDELQLLADWRDHLELVGAPDSDEPREYAFVDASYPAGQSAWYQLRHESLTGLITVHDWIEHVGPPLLPSVRLNELMADNDSVIADESGQFDDWLELFNPGPEPVSLLGLALSDEVDDPAPWPLPAGVLGPGEFLLIWCDEDENQGPFHADFKLSADGEAAALFLVDAGVPHLVDSVVFGPQTTDVAYGRLPDGDGAWRVLLEPTPGLSNATPTAATPPGARGLVLHGVSPNPAGERAELRFALGPDAAGPVRIAVYDLRGRLVRELFRGDLWAGQHVAAWDRRDGAGRRAPAGIYLLRATARGGSETAKLGLVK